MAAFAVLRHVEAVCVDVECLVQLYASVGEDDAEDIIVQALDDIGENMCEIVRLSEARDHTKLGQAALRIAVLAPTVGLSRLGAVARDVADTCDGGDRSACLATLARLRRVADAALPTIWDLHQSVK